jgi:hypothetical protein
MFGSAHVTGASAAIPGESSNSTDDDVHEVEKSPLDAKLSTLLNKKKKRNAKQQPLVVWKTRKRRALLCGCTSRLVAR